MAGSARLSIWPLDGLSVRWSIEFSLYIQLIEVVACILWSVLVRTKWLLVRIVVSIAHDDK